MLKSLNISVDAEPFVPPSKNIIDRGLYVVHPHVSGFTLTVVTQTGIQKRVLKTMNELDTGIKTFLEEWEVLEKLGKRTVLYQRKGSFVYPITQTTLSAFECGKSLTPINVDEWNHIRKMTSTSFPFSSGTKSALAEFMLGSVLYTPYIRGDLLRLNNNIVLSGDNDYARSFEIVRILKELLEISAKTIITTFSKNAKTTEKMPILFKFSTLAAKIQPARSLKSFKKGLRPEQIDAARKFAKPETECLLLYWAPGVGKTAGAWACILEMIKTDKPSTVGVVFLSSGVNLPKSKFVDELLQATDLFGNDITITTVQNEEHVTNANQVREAVKLNNEDKGWGFTFKIKIGEVETIIKVFASTYKRYATCASAIRWKMTLENKHLFMDPRLCDCVVNVCDEAHILRETSIQDLQNGSANSIVTWKNTNEDSETLEKYDKKLLAVVKSSGTIGTTFGESLEEQYKLADAWCAEPAHPSETKITWEAMRLPTNFYIRAESTDDPIKATPSRKTIMLTATPFGNTETQFLNLLTCAQYVTTGVDEQFAENLSTLEQVKQMIDKESFVTSSASVDPQTAPYQNFSCCHIFVGGGGNIIASNGTTFHPGGVPWMHNTILKETILKTGTSEANVEFLYTRPPEAENVDIEFVKQVIKKKGEDSYTITYSNIANDNIANDNNVKSRTVSRKHPLTSNFDLGKILTIAEVNKRDIATIHEMYLYQCPDTSIPDHYMNDFSWTGIYYFKDPEQQGLFHYVVPNVEYPEVIEYPTDADKDAAIVTPGTSKLNYTANGVAANIVAELNLVYERGGLGKQPERTVTRAIGLNVFKYDPTDITARTAREDNPMTRDFTWKNLRAYSPKYEMFFYALEKMAPTPIMLFFKIVAKHSGGTGSMSSFPGFIRYAEMRTRHFVKDHDSDNQKNKHYYYFLTFDSAMTIKNFQRRDEKTKNFKLQRDTYLKIYSDGQFARFAWFNTAIETMELNLVECLFLYSMIETTKKGSLKSLEPSFLTHTRTLMWNILKNNSMTDKKMETLFLEDVGNKHHVICSVVGSDKQAMAWATYMCDRMSGVYNHPLNKDGRLVRVMAGADKIAESNDFRNTRHMFFMYPETDIVKLLQKFGRISRNSDKTEYPYYSYGFHESHCLATSTNSKPDDASVEPARPIVHYVTLASSQECRRSFEQVARKSQYYNEYGRLLSRDQTDEGLIMLTKKTAAEFKETLAELWQTTTIFDPRGSISGNVTTSTNLLSNLYGGVEWQIVATLFTDFPIRDWLLEQSRTQWTTERMQEFAREMDTSIKTDDVSKLRCFEYYGSGYIAQIVKTLVDRPQSNVSFNLLTRIHPGWTGTLKQANEFFVIPENERLKGESLNTFVLELLREKFQKDPFQSALLNTENNILSERYGKYVKYANRRVLLNVDMGKLLETVRAEIQDRKSAPK
jgi:hypothetical protein